MTHDQSDELSIRRYLLGEAPQEEGGRVEERLLCDSDFLDQLNLVEDELIDEYARGVLSDREHEKFNDFFLSSPERRLKLEVLQSLKSRAAYEAQDVNTTGPVLDRAPWWAALSASLGFRRSPAVIFSLAIFLLVVLPGITWLIYKSVPSQGPDLRARVPEEGRTNPESPPPHRPPINAHGADSNAGLQHPDQAPPQGGQNASLPPAKAPPAGGQGGASPERNTVYAITLSGGLVRGGQDAKGFTIPRTTKLVRLIAEFESEGHRKYRAVVRNINTGEQTTRDDLKARVVGKGKRVVFTLSPKNLKSGDYIMSLAGVTSGGETEDIRSYYFHIISQ